MYSPTQHSSPRLRRRSKLSPADQVQVLKTPEPELLGVAEAARDISSSLVDSEFRLPNKVLVFSVLTSYGIRRLKDISLKEDIEFSKKRERLETKELERKAKMREDRLRRMQAFQASSRKRSKRRMRMKKRSSLRRWKMISMILRGHNRNKTS